MTRFPHPLLVADVGGTNARFRWHDAPGAEPGPVLRRATKGHASFEAAAATLDLPARPRSLILCAAGALDGRRVDLTNAGWTLDGPRIADALGLEQGLLLNDFEAMALAAPILPDEAFRPIGPARPVEREGVRLVIGPGTGLGVGLAVCVEGRWRALPGEGGHVDLAAIEPGEVEIWARARADAGRVTPETLLAGAGLARLHRARVGSAALADAADLVARAKADPAGPEAETLRHAWRILARVAGDLALICMPTGGVAIAGGIPPKIVDFLDEGAFAAAFSGKAPHSQALARLPVRLLLHEEAPLDAMAALGADPGRFSLDYAARLWR